ncbi:MAG: YdeI family protein [Candidatus Bathyarchaeota archaeon]
MSVEHHRFLDPGEWRRWLEVNHSQDEAIWVVIQKVKSPNPGIKYDEALDEALCFGWIDGKMRRLDEYEFIQWFSPRRRNSLWSRRNRDKVEMLNGEGRMTGTGLAEVEKAKMNGRWESAYSLKDTPTMPDDLLEALKSNKVAHDNFSAFPNSARFMYIHWINDAKRDSTRARRINRVVERAAENRKPGIDM